VGLRGGGFRKGPPSLGLRQLQVAINGRTQTGKHNKKITVQLLAR